MLGYTLWEIARVLDAELENDAEAEVARVCTDTRAVAPGDLFFALAGERFDGHRFVADALARGAVGAVVRADWQPDGPTPGPLLRVADPLLALGTLAGYHRDRLARLKVVGVTGSLGKTTTKDLLAAALGVRWRTHANRASLNAEIGLPQTLLETTPEHEALVVEMAMRGREQIRYLARLARPRVGVITNIGLSHFELLGTQEAIAAAKAELLEELPPDGAAVLPADDAFFPFLAGKAPRVVSFGFSEAADVRGRLLAAGGPGGRGARFAWSAPGHAAGELEATLPLPGRHNVLNALAAIGAALELGVPAAEIGPALAGARVSAMRMEILRAPGGFTLLNDAYNASSPQAMVAALDVLADPAFPGRKVAALGDMLELGPAAEAAHREVGAAAAERLTGGGLLVAVGDLAAGLAAAAREAGMPAEAAVHCADNERALAALRERLQADDVVLVKGSRGMGMEAIVRGLCDAG